VRSIFCGALSESASARRAHSVLPCFAVSPSSHFTKSFFRALCAAHQLSATIATPGIRPSSAVV